MNKEITLEEYVLTNLHPGDWGYYIRLKDNIEYQVYKRKPRGQKLYYFIKKDNEEIRLDEEVRKCFLQSKREYERYRNMKNYFKEAEKIIKQEKIKRFQREKKQRKHLINTMDSLTSGGISIFDLEVVNKNAIKVNYRDKIKKLQKINDLMAEQLAGLAIFDNDIENALILGDKEEVKKYYERKAANEEE